MRPEFSKRSLAVGEFVCQGHEKAEGPGTETATQPQERVSLMQWALSRGVSEGRKEERGQGKAGKDSVLAERNRKSLRVCEQPMAGTDSTAGRSQAEPVLILLHGPQAPRGMTAQHRAGGASVPPETPCKALEGAGG